MKKLANLKYFATFFLLFKARFWRKNRGKVVCSKDRWHRQRCCTGVDLNRNFDFYWGGLFNANFSLFINEFERTENVK